MSEGVTLDVGLDADLKGGNDFLRLLTSIDGTLKKLDNNFGKAERDVEKLGSKAKSEFRGVGHAVDELKGSVREMLEYSGGMAIFEGLKKGVEIARELGTEILHAATGNERLTRSFENLMGVKPAHETIEWIERIAGKTEFKEDTLKGFASQLAAAGFKPGDQDKFLAAALDVAARSSDKRKADEAVSAFARAQLTGTLSTKQLVGLNIPLESFRTLPQFEGLKDDALKKKLEEGKISLKEVLAVIAGPDKELGDLGVKMGATMGAKLEHLQERPEQFLERFSESPVFERAKAKLASIIDETDPNNPAMLRMFESLEKGADHLVTALEKIDIKDTLLTIERVFTALPGLIEETTRALRALGTVFGGTARGVAAVDDVLRNNRVSKAIQGSSLVHDYTPIGFLQDLFGTAKHAGSEGTRGAGADVSRGLVDGMMGGAGDVRGAGAALGNAAKDGADTSLERHSPSRVFREIGRDTAAGFSLGIRDSADAVDASVRGLFSMRQPQRAADVAAAAGGAPNLTVSTEVHVHVGAGADAKAIGDVVASRVSEVDETALLRAIARIAAGAGGAP